SPAGSNRASCAMTSRPRSYKSCSAACSSPPSSLSASAGSGSKKPPPPPPRSSSTARDCPSLVVLSRGQELVPMLGDRGRAGEVGLDHLDEPRLVGCDAVPVEEPLEIGEQEAALAGQPRDAAINCVQAPS